MKRTLTSIILLAVLAAFALLGYFVSPIFIDMLTLVFMAGATYEMYHCLKVAGYRMFVLPPVFAFLTAYPVFYLMQYYLGGKYSSAGLQGLLLVLLAATAITLTIFTFLPNRKGGAISAPDVKGDPSERATQNASDNTDAANSADATAYGAADVGDNVDLNGEGAQSDGASAAKHVGKLGIAGLNDLFANIFLLVYPMAFFAAVWVMSYKYSGLFAILYAIAVPIVGSDLFAYLFGKLIGGKKLCPTVSPKKTIAGAVGGLFGSMTVSTLFWLIFEYVGSLAPAFTQKCGYTPFFSDGTLYKSALCYLAIGLIVGVASELGDLAASRIKRALGIKDYGKIFPGHGGFMDRIDSVMYALVILLAAFSIIYKF